MEVEVEDVNEQIEWEVKRVAAAFGLEDWTSYRSGVVWHGTGKAGSAVVT